MAQETEQIRELAVAVIQFLIPGYPALPSGETVPKEAYQQLQTAVLTEDTMKRVHFVYRHLLTLLPLCRLHWKTSEVDPGNP